MRLYNEDCIKTLKLLPDNYVDLVVTDPPYRVTSRGSAGTMGGYWKSDKAKKGTIFDYNDISCKDYLPELYRILKDGSILYIMCNNVNLQEMINVGTSCGFKFVKNLIWEKGNKICGKYYMGCYEYVILFRKGKDRPIYDCSTPDIIKIPQKKLKGSDGNNLHDTEKPIELQEVLISNSSLPGDKVLDPFMGIGSVGIACKRLKRDFIGIEIDKKYFDIAVERIDTEEENETKS